MLAACCASAVHPLCSQAQQEALDRLMEIFRRQQQQLVKLQDQLSGREEERQKQMKKEVQAGPKAKPFVEFLLSLAGFDLPYESSTSTNEHVEM